MDIMELTLPQTNRLASSYLDGGQVLSFFDYHYGNPAHFNERLAELGNRTFPREALSEILLTYNKRFSPSEAVLDNIEKLKQPESVTVVGGQQAGVLTGPLYSIHKCISVIQLARQQEERLGIPVIPVFWIAGEDHDFDEINHTYVMKNNRPRKKVAPNMVTQKKSASALELDKEQLKPWVDDIIRSYGETEHTKAILHLLEESLDHSDTFVDWFAHLIMALFKDYGLVLVDSGDPRMRAIETPVFNKMIDNNPGLNDRVLKQIQQLNEAGFEETIDIDEHSANLFYHVDGERVLLERDAEGNFRGKNNECLLSLDEMQEEAAHHPERLSNNVVTRPLMQESLFPTLAFIAGPGEIAYWSTLREAFHLFDYKVPPLVPRLNITMVDRQTEKWLADHGHSAEEALTKGIDQTKQRWLSNQQEWDVESEANSTKREIDAIHKHMRDLAVKVDPHLETLAGKNIGHLMKQVDYFADQIERVYRGRYNRELSKFDHIEACLWPKQGPQERVWSVFPFLNRYGMDLVGRLTTTHPFTFNGKHKVVFL
ncbi:MAG TPA: bacillithiol biosynthesis cysteine-adding enzyme BshC [Bacillales bacterium]|nr:bacillithiol biosynthesis cysteine-adding enzyme BshC [Bacillales bacterium]